MPDFAISDFETLCLPFMSRLRSLALLWTLNPHDADDRVQDTFVHAMKAWPLLRISTDKDPSIRVGAWLNRILRNVCIDGWRRRASHEEAVALWESDIKVLQYHVSYQPSDLSREMQSAFLALEPAEQEIIMLADIQKHTGKEIADHYKIPSNTAKSRLNRARKRLGKSLAG